MMEGTSIDSLNRMVETSIDPPKMMEETTIDSHKMMEETSIDSHKMMEETSIDSHKMMEETSIDSHKMMEGTSIDSNKMMEETSIDSNKMMEETSIDSHKMMEETSIDSHKMMEETWTDSHKMMEETSIDSHRMVEETSIDPPKMMEETSIDSNKMMEETSIDSHKMMEETSTDSGLNSTESISEDKPCTPEPIIKEEEPVKKDLYCHKCHRDARRTVPCSNCIRSYHFKCVKVSLRINPADFVCKSCKDVIKEKSSEPRISRDRLKRVFEYAIDQITYDRDSSVLVELYNPKSLAGYPKHIVFPIGFDDIKLKISEKKYETIHEFLDDVRWIYHNCYIVNKARAPLTNRAKTLYERAVKQCAKMWNCMECYENELTASVDWFSLICTKPHVPGWAKVTGYSYWPCKVLKVIDTYLEVSFFGSHDRSRIAASACRVLSKEKPLNIKVTKPMLNALAEINLYVMNLRKKYGVFNYAPAKTLFDPAKDYYYRALMLTKMEENTSATEWKRLEMKTVPIPSIEVGDVSDEAKAIIDRYVPIAPKKKLETSMIRLKNVKAPMEIEEYAQYTNDSAISFSGSDSFEVFEPQITIHTQPKKESGWKWPALEEDSSDQFSDSSNSTVREDSTTSKVGRLFVKQNLLKPATVHTNRAGPAADNFLPKTHSEPPINTLCDKVFRKIPVVVLERMDSQWDKPFLQKLAADNGDGFSINLQPPASSSGKSSLNASPGAVTVKQEPIDDSCLQANPLETQPLGEQSSYDKMEELKRIVPGFDYEVTPRDDGSINRRLTVPVSIITDHPRSVFERLLGLLTEEHKLRAATLLLFQLKDHKTRELLKYQTKCKKLEIFNNQMKERLALQASEFRSKIDYYKTTKWCSNCGIRAEFHCCWSASYCSPKCQQDHWRVHFRNCKQKAVKKSNSVKMNPGKVVHIKDVIPGLANSEDPKTVEDAPHSWPASSVEPEPSGVSTLDDLTEDKPFSEPNTSHSDDVGGVDHAPLQTTPTSTRKRKNIASSDIIEEAEPSQPKKPLMSVLPASPVCINFNPINRVVKPLVISTITPSNTLQFNQNYSINSEPKPEVITSTDEPEQYPPKKVALRFDPVPMKVKADFSPRLTFQRNVRPVLLPMNISRKGTLKYVKPAAAGIPTKMISQQHRREITRTDRTFLRFSRPVVGP